MLASSPASFSGSCIVCSVTSLVLSLCPGFPDHIGPLPLAGAPHDVHPRDFIHSASPDCTVAALSAWLRECHASRFVQLVDADASLFSPGDTLRVAGVRDGHRLTLVLQVPVLA